MRALTSIVVSALARVEVPAAMWRKHRVGAVAPEDAAAGVHAFEADWIGGDRGFAIMRVTEEILSGAARLVARHPLRALDAIQLASALTAQAMDPGITDFVCFDVSLAAAARVEGLRVIP